MHISIPTTHSCEFIEITPVNPLISKCQIKVCYVSDEPNRNGSVITKEVAKEMANSLPGCPIVGFYNEETEDFEQHNRSISFKDGEIVIGDDTIPYGFVDMNPRVWFQKFMDDGNVEHEYLMTEGYIWTGQYEEARRIIERGNNQSMELDGATVKGTWTKGDNGKPQFFIINEAIISKLCILGEDVEPCFEGSQITKVQFALDDGFKESLYSMAKELKQILDEGGTYSMENIEENVVETEVVEEFAAKEDEKKKEQEKEEPKKEEAEGEKEEKSEEPEEDEKKKKKEEYQCDDDKKKHYSAEEYDALQNSYDELKAQFDAMNSEIAGLREFKLAADRKQKEEMIASFYMLSDEDKADVIANVDTYSLDDIEAKLSIICVRNKVNFNLNEEVEDNTKQALVFNLEGNEGAEDNAPAWIKAVRDNMKK